MNTLVKGLLTAYIIGFSVILLLNFNGEISNLIVTSSIYAALLNLLNTYAAVIFFNRSYKSGSQKFMIYNLGGLALRLFVLLIFIGLAIKFLNIDKYAFILVFFLFYFISLIFEVVFYLKKTAK